MRSGLQRIDPSGSYVRKANGIMETPILLGPRHMLFGQDDDSDLRDDGGDCYEVSSRKGGGLPAFKELPAEQKLKFREKAIRSIKDDCTIRKTAGIVAGHATFWDEKDDGAITVITPKDLEIYSHILYLKTDPEVIQQQRLRDLERNRDIVSVDHLKKWQDQEESMLHTLCRVHGIHFSVVSPRRDTESEDMFLIRLWRLVSDLGLHNENVYRSNAMSKLEEAMDTDATRGGRLRTMLVMDADKTSAPQDVGNMFWGKVSISGASSAAKNPMKGLFGGPSGYSYHSFRQATLLYEEAVSDGAFNDICEELASEVAMYPEFLTAGLKADLVAHIQDAYQAKVYAFGDSPLDLPMLIQADRAIVVVGDENSRSKSMETALGDAIRTQGLVASQLVLPSTATPRLDSAKLPLLRLSQADIEAILCNPNFRLIHATNSSASKLLTTQTRDSTGAGPALREAHRRIGWYLAVEFISKVIGLESYEIPHVQGGHT
ncbi:hypothetical protein V493_07358 [Pseudogymnoascus sp. VKM F-4281 (FW-2241)]|nr:hypothetical protein V493_07358 [Pseudogymnoascus sp. VKM F-4281 (FW-2241)]